MGHFFGPASNPTHLRLTRDPTRRGSIKCNALCCCMLVRTMKPLKHFIIALPMFDTRRNRRIHISYKSWTQNTRYVHVVKVQSHESSRVTGRFAPWMFRPQDVSPSGRFAPTLWTNNYTDINNCRTSTF